MKEFLHGINFALFYVSLQRSALINLGLRINPQLPDADNAVEGIAATGNFIQKMEFLFLQIKLNAT